MRDICLLHGHGHMLRAIVLTAMHLQSVHGHGHMLRAVVRAGSSTPITACAVNAVPHCQSTAGLKMRKLIPRSGNNPPCNAPPGCELGCEGNGNGPGGTGGGPNDLPCPNQGICDHCALEKTASQKGIVGGDDSKWWTRMPAAHWDEPDQWPIFPCMSRDAFGAQGTTTIEAGDSITTTIYVNADHSGLYRYEFACGEQATNADFNAAGADLTPWLALHPSKELSPLDTPLANSREVGRTRAETDAYYSRTVCTAANCPYRMNGGGGGRPVAAHELGSPSCGPVPAAGTATTVGPPVDANSPVQCFIEDTFTLPRSTACRGSATLRWMWNSAEGLETYANCLDLSIVGSVAPDEGGSDGGDGSDGGIGGNGGVANGASDRGGGSGAGLVVAFVILAVLGAAAYWYHKRRGAAPPPAPAGVQLAAAPRNLQRRQSEDPAWVTEPSKGTTRAPPPPPSAPPLPATPLPDGFREVLDPSTGRNYFYNERDGTTTWTRPTPGAIPV